MPVSLPAWTYTNEEFFALEFEALFQMSWQLVCHQSNIPNPGDYYTFEFLNESFLIVRGKDRVLRAFHNVCRHRGARIVDGPEGNCGGRLTCPYHAWTYGLDGSLIGVPGHEDFDGLDLDTHGLVPANMEIFFGFVFVCIERPDRSVAEMFAPYIEELSIHRFEDLAPMDRLTERMRPVNWKNIADNYSDAMHIAPAHKELNSLVGDTYKIEVRGDIHKMWGDITPTPLASPSVRAYDTFLPNVAHLPADAQRRWVYYRMWPNFAFDIYPDQVDFMQFVPISAEKTLVREIPYALPDDRREMKAARYLNWRINRGVNKEDTDLITRVQSGMRSSSFTSGPLAKSEVALIHAGETLRRLIPVSQVLEEPMPGQVRSQNEKLTR
jgi:phenylpropionate dioxygenase-like ring-hydroxylating dioxygenase large terminal subunit